MEEKEIMTFLDESGNKMEFEAIAKIYVEEKQYLILSPIDGNEEDAYIFRVDIEDEKEVLNFVDEEEEFNQVKKEYSKLIYNKE